ncbi:MAG: sugar ABC transporter substrate-binding protein [Ruminococcaceae bacterium]|nr:sugar ABC transporter substrate-binding protein [Oscillospiraceae bacterium]
MKKLIAILLVLVLIFAFSACKKEETPPAPAEDTPEASDPVSTTEEKETFKVGLSMHNTTAEWAVTFKDTFLAEAEKVGFEVVWNDSASKADTQVANMEDLLIQDIDLLVVLPVDYTAIGTGLQEAFDSKIPVINADSMVGEEDQQYVTAFIKSDTYAAGYSLGEYLCDMFPDGATIATLNVPTNASIAARFEGINDAVKDLKRDDIKIVNKDRTSRDAVGSDCEDLIIANSEIAAFVCYNDNSGMTCQGICEQLNRTDIRVFGFDGDPAAKQSIAAGEMYGTMVYSPVGLAKQAVVVADAILNNKPYEEFSIVDMWLIDRDNIGEYDTAVWE